MLCVLSMRMRGAIRNAAQASHNVWHLPPIRVSCSILVEDMRRVDALEWFGDRILSGLLTDILNEDFISFPQQFTTLCRPLLAANATLALLMVKMKLKMNGTKEEIKTKGDLFEVIVALYACEQPRHVVREWLKSVFDPLVRVAAIEYLLHYSTSGLPYFPRKVHDETTKRKALHPIPASMPSTTTLPAGTNWNESTPPQPERTNPESWALFSLTSSTVDQRPSDSPLECSASQTAKLNPSPSRGRKALCEMGKVNSPSQLPRRRPSRSASSSRGTRPVSPPRTSPARSSRPPLRPSRGINIHRSHNGRTRYHYDHDPYPRR